MKTNPPPKDKPDLVQFFVRFGCGFLFAIVLVLSLGLIQTVGEFVVFSLILGFIFGLLAAKYGDRFWQKLSDWLR
ncbi:MAG: hypothetical protein F6K35_48630 [Okeania sp. SIO2H7]|nr:hypothetical protein [Okeania sp. SIO2H7]